VQYPTAPLGPFPTAPMPAVEYRAPRAPERPRTVEVAFWLWCALNAVGFLLVLVEFLLGQSTGADLLRAVFSLAIGVALAIAMRQGRNWARLLLVICAMLSIAFTVASTAAVVVSVPPVFSNTSLVFLVIAMLGDIGLVAALVLMFRRDSTEFFRRS
jgi:hypothetical protein